MDKIRQLLEKLGSKEMAGQIIEAFEAHAKALREETESEYKARLQKAKSVCIEEVENYKKELAKKAQIFFESRVDRIEQQIAKQVAIRESEAEGKLSEIKALVEGVTIDSAAESETLKVLKKKVAELTSSLRTVVESREAAELKANRAHSIAEKALKRNRDLERMLSESAEKTKKVVEPAKDEKSEVVSEGKTAKDQAKQAKTVKPTAARPKTSTPVNESTIRKAPVTEVKTTSKGNYTITAIAEGTN